MFNRNHKKAVFLASLISFSCATEDPELSQKLFNTEEKTGAFDISLKLPSGVAKKEAAIISSSTVTVAGNFQINPESPSSSLSVVGDADGANPWIASGFSEGNFQKRIPPPSATRPLYHGKLIFQLEPSRSI